MLNHREKKYLLFQHVFRLWFTWQELSFKYYIYVTQFNAGNVAVYIKSSIME